MTVGVGQQDPSDSSSDFNKQRFLIQRMLSRISTMKIVRVESVSDASGGAVVDTGAVAPAGYVSVTILTNQVDGDGNAIPHGVINNIPYFRLQGGGNGCIIDPSPGDIGVMTIADRDISSVKSTRSAANPGSFRQFDPADGVYHGSIVGGAPSQYVRFRKDGVELVDKNGNSYVTTPDGVTVTDASDSTFVMSGGDITVTPKSGTTTFNGDVAVTGELRGDSGGTSVSLNTHTHSQPADSHGDTEAETNAPTPGT